jgi:hypothetical protein
MCDHQAQPGQLGAAGRAAGAIAGLAFGLPRTQWHIRHQISVSQTGTIPPPLGHSSRRCERGPVVVAEEGPGGRLIRWDDNHREPMEFGRHSVGPAGYLRSKHGPLRSSLDPCSASAWPKFRWRRNEPNRLQSRVWSTRNLSPSDRRRRPHELRATSTARFLSAQ